SIFCITFLCFFFLIDPPTTMIYTLSLHTLFRSDLGWLTAVIGPLLPELRAWFDPSRNWLFVGGQFSRYYRGEQIIVVRQGPPSIDRKSTRLNSSHSQISYAVFCLKNKNSQRHARSCGSASMKLRCYFLARAGNERDCVSPWLRSRSCATSKCDCWWRVAGTRANTV